jgi:hypothetical protein
LFRCDPDLVSDQFETQHETLASHVPDTREVIAQLFQLEEVVGSHFLAHLLALIFLYYLHLHTSLARLKGRLVSTLITDGLSQISVNIYFIRNIEVKGLGFDQGRKQGRGQGKRGNGERNLPFGSSIAHSLTLTPTTTSVFTVQL